jgi:hypothetical protein
VPLGRITLTEDGKSESRSTSIRTLAYKSRVICAVESSQWIGFPIMLAIFDKQIWFQHHNDKQIGNLTHVGIVVISRD